MTMFGEDITAERSPQFDDFARELNRYIELLHIDMQQKTQLTKLIVDIVTTGEKDAFFQGFCVGEAAAEDERE